VKADGAAAALLLLDAQPEIALLFTDIVRPDVDGAKLGLGAASRISGFTTGYSRTSVVHNGRARARTRGDRQAVTIAALAAQGPQRLDSHAPGDAGWAADPPSKAFAAILDATPTPRPPSRRD